MKNPTTLTGHIQDSIYDTVKKAGQQADNILIGDANHQSLEIRNLFSNEDFIKALAEAGCLHLCLEIPAALQHYLEDFTDVLRDDSATPEMIEKAENLFRARMIFNYESYWIDQEDMIDSVINIAKHATRYGMDLHFVDPGQGLDIETMPESYIKAMENVIKVYEKHTGEEVDMNSSEAIKNALHYVQENDLLSPRKQRALNKGLDDLIRVRTQDARLYEEIETATNGEKAAVIYGAYHEDIAARLGRSTLIIDLYQNRKRFDSINEADLSEAVEYTPEGDPDIVYILDEEKTYVTDKAESRFTQDLEIAPLETVSTNEAAPAIQPERPQVF